MDSFNAMWRKDASDKLHKAGITNNPFPKSMTLFPFQLLSVFSAFSKKDSIETYTSDWTYTTIGISQRSLFITFIFLVFAADIMTLEEHKQTDEICSKYAV